MSDDSRGHTVDQRMGWLVTNLVPIAIIFACVTVVVLVTWHVVLPAHPEQLDHNIEIRERVVRLETTLKLTPYQRKGR